MMNKLLMLLSASLVAIIIWLQFSPRQVIVENIPVNLNGEGDSKLEDLSRQVALLEQGLQHEINKRQQLEKRLTNLEDIKYSVDDNLQLSAGNTIIPLTAPTDESIGVKQKLLEAGMLLETINAMKQSVDRNQLEMLELRNRAIREGWDETVEYSEQIHQVSNPFRGLQQEYGEEAYDLYLYASGTPNRVEIREVYSGSAADQAGLQAGDIFVRYAYTPIYAMSELRQATLEGEAGEIVLIELLRDGQAVTSSVPRGPLGISMTMTLVNPE